MEDIIIHGEEVRSVLTDQGQTLIAEKLVLTTGTFLNGVMFKGNERISGGRAGDDTSIPLSKKLYDLNKSNNLLRMILLHHHRI